jgi:uncharacterized protein with HEPN domain
MPRDNALLFDILESARMAVGYLSDSTIESFGNDVKCQDSVIRRLEIIGEAAGRVSAETQDKFPDIPWRDMKDMRNLLIHEYSDVDIDEVWRTVKRDLPPLIQNLEKIIPFL